MKQRATTKAPTPGRIMVQNHAGKWNILRNVKPHSNSPPLIIGKENPEQLISGYLRYPFGAHEKGISGRVLISFIVDKDGNACDFKVFKGVCKKHKSNESS